MKRVVITGTGIVSCIGNDNAAVTASLRESRSGIRCFAERAIAFDNHASPSGRVCVRCLVHTCWRIQGIEARHPDDLRKAQDRICAAVDIFQITLIAHNADIVRAFIAIALENAYASTCADSESHASLCAEPSASIQADHPAVEAGQYVAGLNDAIAATMIGVNDNRCADKRLVLVAPSLIAMYQSAFAVSREGAEILGEDMKFRM